MFCEVKYVKKLKSIIFFRRFVSEESHRLDL